MESSGQQPGAAAVGRLEEMRGELSAVRRHMDGTRAMVEQAARDKAQLQDAAGWVGSELKTKQQELLHLQAEVGKLEKQRRALAETLLSAKRDAERYRTTLSTLNTELNEALAASTWLDVLIEDQQRMLVELQRELAGSRRLSVLTATEEEETRALPGATARVIEHGPTEATLHPAADEPAAAQTEPAEAEANGARRPTPRKAGSDARSEIDSVTGELERLRKSLEEAL